MDVANGGTGQSTYAKGDVLVGTPGGVLARLPAGLDSLVLLADSSQLNGVRWGSPGGRKVLVATTNYYVAVTGSDVTGDGSSGNPWATVDRANTVLQTQVDFGGQTVNLIIGAGVYTTGPTNFGGYVGGGYLIVQGATSNPSLVVLHEGASGSGAAVTIAFASSAIIRFDQLTFRPTISSSAAIRVNQLTDVEVSASLANHTIVDLATDNPPYPNLFACRNGGNITMFGNVDVKVGASGIISGSLVCIGPAESMQTGYAGIVSNTTFTFDKGFDNSALGFAYCDHGEIDSGDTFIFTTGSATGKRFGVTNGGIIQTYGSNNNYFPGTAMGTLDTGGQYL
jgi:hypothetical protein